MSDLEPLSRQVEAWLQPLGGDEGPCGPDLEYDNAFLELTKAAEGKPETQFERGTPPDWRAVRSQVDDIFDRTRDLRVALLWLRAVISLEGAAALVPGLQLVLGLLQNHWEQLHPQPDPSDNDPYARANALAVLPQMEGVLGDLLGARLTTVKGVGEIRMRAVEVALGNLGARDGEPEYGRDQLERMFASAEQEGAGLRALLLQSQQLLKQLGGVMDERFGSGSSADLKPLLDLYGHVLMLVPEPRAEDDGGGGDDPAAAGADGAAPAARGGGRAGISGSVTTRAEAVRAIELVCAYLEQHEPTNPAQLFLHRARNLLERNFLELIKELAPDALDGVARIVGVDPESVGQPRE